MHRTKPIGSHDAGWTCEPCLAEHEPELLANVKEPSEYKVLEDIMEILKS